MWNIAKKEVTNNALFTICPAANVLGIEASVHMKEAASLENSQHIATWYSCEDNKRLLFICCQSAVQFF